MTCPRSPCGAKRATEDRLSGGAKVCAPGITVILLVGLMGGIRAVAWLAMALGGAVWWWRFGPDRSDGWMGPAAPHWLLVRRLMLCGRFGAAVACVGALVFAGILVVARRTDGAVSMVQLAVTMVPACVLLYVVAAALDGPSSSAGGLRPNSRVPGKAHKVHYLNRDWFQLVLLPIVLVGVAGFAISVAVVPALNTENLPPAVSWGLAAAFLLALGIQLGSVVVSAEVKGGRLRGHTMLRFRGFDYELRQVQISWRTVLLPAEELLLVSHMGWWPVVFSCLAPHEVRIERL